MYVCSGVGTQESGADKCRLSAKVELEQGVLCLGPMWVSFVSSHVTPVICSFRCALY